MRQVFQPPLMRARGVYGSGLTVERGASGKCVGFYFHPGLESRHASGDGKASSKAVIEQRCDRDREGAKERQVCGARTVA